MRTVCLLSLMIFGVTSPCFGDIKLGDRSQVSATPADRIDTDDPLAQGKQYVKEKRYELAIETYTHALQENTSKFDLYIARSRAYIGLRQYQEALADAELAIKERPDHPLGYSNRGFAFGLMNKLEDAIADFTKAIEISPSTSQFYAMRGAANLEFGRHQKALEDLSLAIQIGEDKVNPIVFEHRAMAFRKLGRYEEALRDLSESLRKDPSLMSSRLHRGSVYRCLSKYELAKVDFDEVINKDPDRLEAYLQRAFVSMERNDYKSAYKDLEYADRKGMKDPHLLLSLAYAHYRLGNISEAIKVNERATSLFPDKLRATATLQKGIFLLASGNLDSARELLLAGQDFAERSSDLESIEDTLDDLDRLETQNIISKSAAKEIRIRLKNTLGNVRSPNELVRSKCDGSN